MPAIISARVDFPPPFGPVIAVKPPSISRVMSLSISFFPFSVSAENEMFSSLSILFLRCFYWLKCDMIAAFEYFTAYSALFGKREQSAAYGKFRVVMSRFENAQALLGGILCCIVRTFSA